MRPKTNQPNKKNQTKIKQNKKDGGLFVSRMDTAATMLGHSAVSEVDNRYSLSHSFLYLCEEVKREKGPASYLF